MADRMELLAEGHRRGILTPELESEYQRSVGGNGPTAKAGSTGDEYLKTLPPEVASQVKGLAAGRIAFPSGAALRSPYWQQMLSNVASYDPNFDAVNYGARYATRKDFTSGKGAQNIRALNTAIGHLGQLSSQIDGTWSTGGLPGATLVNTIGNAISKSSGDPGPTKFAQTAGALASELTLVFRGSGGAEADIKRYLEELDPNASLEQKKAAISNISGLLQSRLEAIKDQYVKGMGTTAQPLDILDPKAEAFLGSLAAGGAGAAVAPSANSTTPPPLVGDPVKPATSAPIFDAMNAGAYGRTTGPETIDTEFKGVDNADLRAKNEQVLAAVAANQPDEQILALAQRLGVDPTATGLGAILAYRKKTGLLKYADTTDYQSKVPLSPGEKAINSVVANPAVEFTQEAGNAAMAGIPQALAVGVGGDDMARNLTAARNTSPRAAIAGDMAGTVAGAVGTELAALRLLQGTKYAGQAARVGDAAFGAVSGATGNPDDPLKGAATGAALNLAGGELGRGIIGGVANTISPTGGKYADLYANGGRPTFGQRVVDAGEPGSLARFAGSAVNNLEQAGESLPISGLAVRGARGDGMASWERAGINKSLKSIGEPPLPKDIQTGSEAFAYAGPKFSKIYDQARSGMQFAPDGQFATDLGGWQAKFRNGALSGDQEAQVDRLIRSEVGNRLQKGGGILTGENYKLATSALADAAETADSPAVQVAIKEYNDILKAGAYRVSDPAAVKLMKKADDGWSFYKPLALAASRAGSEPGRFTPTGVAAEERVRFGKTQRYIEGNTKLNDYVQRGMAMRDTLPNTGTVDRAMAGQVLGAATLGGAGALAGASVPIGASALAVPYLPGIRKGVAALMAPSRIPEDVALAAKIRANYQAGGGPTGQGLLDAYLEQRRMQNQPGLAGAYR